jgi:hypothetical protein
VLSPCTTQNRSSRRLQLHPKEEAACVASRLSRAEEQEAIIARAITNHEVRLPLIVFSSLSG